MEHQNAIVSIIIRVNYSFLHNVDFSKTKKSASQINRGIYRGENEKMAAHSRTDEWDFHTQSHWTSLRSVTLYIVLTSISVWPVLCQFEVFRMGQFIYRLIHFFFFLEWAGTKRRSWYESEENENGGQRAGCDRKKAKTEKETDKEETRGGGSFSLTVHHGPLMYEWCDENWFPSELFQALSLL